MYIDVIICNDNNNNNNNDIDVEDTFLKGNRIQHKSWEILKRLFRIRRLALPCHPGEDISHDSQIRRLAVTDP